MSVDTVVEKTAITLLLVVAAATVTWFAVGDVVGNSQAVSMAFRLAFVGMVVGFVLAMVNSFKKVISPPLVMAYALAEGVFVGALSKVVASFVGDQGVVFQAVLATFIAAGATLFVYKFFNIQVTDKFRRMVLIATLALFGVLLANLLLSFTPLVNHGGLRGFGLTGLVVSVVALVLAVLNLVLDFDYIEQGVAAGAPQAESWRAAFGLTVTLVWMYIEMLHILAILRGD